MNFKDYADKFEIFHTVTAEIAVKGNYDDYEGTFAEIQKGSVKGDLQPYSAELAKNEYGLNVICEYAFYYSGNYYDNPDIMPGTFLYINGKRYTVKCVTELDMGSMALLSGGTEK